MQHPLLRRHLGRLQVKASEAMEAFRRGKGALDPVELSLQARDARDVYKLHLRIDGQNRELKRKRAQVIEDGEAGAPVHGRGEARVKQEAVSAERYRELLAQFDNAQQEVQVAKSVSESFGQQLNAVKHRVKKLQKKNNKLTCKNEPDVRNVENSQQQVHVNQGTIESDATDEPGNCVTVTPAQKQSARREHEIVDRDRAAAQTGKGNKKPQANAFVRNRDPVPNTVETTKPHDDYNAGDDSDSSSDSESLYVGGDYLLRERNPRDY
ncbi:hypothetical protein ACHAQH_008555 [Verticillium albo-atrum]